MLSTNASLVTQVHYTDNPGYWGGLVSQNQNGVSSFYGFDGPSNTCILVNSAGSVLATYLYEAFGMEVLTPSASNVYWFGGRYGYQRDWPNRYDVRARHLETANGRWISRDPIGFKAGDMSLYRYVVGHVTQARVLGPAYLPVVLLGYAEGAPWKYMTQPSGDIRNYDMICYMTQTR